MSLPASVRLGQPGAHEHALVTGHDVGTLLLARAVDDPKLADALLNSAQTNWSLRH